MPQIPMHARQGGLKVLAWKRGMKWLFLGWILILMILCAYLGSQKRIELAPSSVPNPASENVSTSGGAHESLQH